MKIFIKPSLPKKKKNHKNKSNSIKTKEYVCYAKLYGGFEIRIFKVLLTSKGNNTTKNFEWNLTGVFGLNKIIDEVGTAISIDDAVIAADRRYRALKEKGGY